jgi:hypothetical protein
MSSETIKNHAAFRKMLKDWYATRVYRRLGEGGKA